MRAQGKDTAETTPHQKSNAVVPTTGIGFADLYFTVSAAASGTAQARGDNVRDGRIIGTFHGGAAVGGYRRRGVGQRHRVVG